MSTPRDSSRARAGGGTTRVYPYYKEEVLDEFYEAFKAAGIDFVVYVPDSFLDGIAQRVKAHGEMELYQSSGEDEGIAMALGAFLAGKRPVVMMEGSGIGLSALILARGLVMHAATLLLISHNSTLGERYDYHGATRLVAEPVLAALNIPRHVLMDEAHIRTVVQEANHTVHGQRVPVGILVPSHVIRDAP